MMKIRAAVLHQIGGHERPYSKSNPLKIEEVAPIVRTEVARWEEENGLK